jgi:hypothetical protein
MQIRPTGTGNVRGIRSALAGVFTSFSTPDLDVVNTDVFILGTSNALSWITPTTVNVNGSLLRGVAAGHSQFGAVIQGIATVNFQLSEITGFPSGLQIASTALPIIGSARINCGSFTSTTGLALGTTTTKPAWQVSCGAVDHLNFTGCDTGVRLNGLSSVDLHGLSGAVGTTAVAILNGGFASLNSANLSVVTGDGGSGQFDINIEAGRVTGSFSDLTPGVCVEAVGFGSRACGQ